MRRNPKKPKNGLPKSLLIPLALTAVLAIAGAGLHVAGRAPWQNGPTNAKATPVPVVRAAPESTPVKPIDLNGGQPLAQAVGIVPAAANERLYLDQLGKVALEAGRLFSFNEWTAGLQKSGQPELNEGEASRLAALIYEAAVRTGLTVGERSLHTDLPDRIAPGFDAAVVPGAKDLTVFNPFGFAVIAGASYSNGLPVVSFKGTPDGKWKLPSITVQKETFAPERVILTDLSLLSGEVKRDNGKDGLLVSVYADGPSGGEPKLVAKDFYAPHPAVAARPPAPDTGKAPGAK